MFAESREETGRKPIDCYSWWANHVGFQGSNCKYTFAG